MSQKLDLRVNRLPVRTWNHLHVNETDLSLAAPDQPAQTDIENPDGMIHEIGQDLLRDFSQVETGMGPDVTGLVRDGSDGRVRCDVFRLRQGSGTVRLKLSSQPGHVTGNFLGLEAKPDTDMTVVMDLATAEEGECAQVVQTRMIAGKGARIRLVQILRTGQKALLLNDVGGLCQEEAAIEIIHLVLGGDNVMIGAAADLAGTGSRFETDTAYLVTGEHRLDMNYVANHVGTKTFSRMAADGMLKDRAAKVFRGTIDFRNGSAGSKGSVTEDVLLMDEDVVNQTVPLILCAEEDVDGSHGATIGQLDDETVFYLQSRGMGLEDIYAMMEKARLLSVVRKVPDQETRHTLLVELGAEEAVPDQD
jgi:hypothetical protein